MSPKRYQIKFTVLAGIMAVLVVLAFASCTPWYKAYELDSPEDMLRISSVPVLIKALEDPKPSIRVKSARALTKIGPDAKEALPALIKAAGDDKYAVRQAAADALEAIEQNFKFSQDDAEVKKVKVQVLATRLESEDWMVRRESVKQLVEIGPAAVDAVPALIRVLEDRNDWHRRYNEVVRGAVTALGNIGPEAKSAVPALLKTLDNEDYEVRLEVVKALGKMDLTSDIGVVEALAEALDDPDFDVRREAAVSLGTIGPCAVAAMPRLLISSMKDIDYNVRRQSLAAMCTIQPGEESAMCVLGQALVDKNPLTRRAAVSGLKNVKPEAREALLPGIIRSLDDIDESVRLNAIKTLAEYKIGSGLVCNALERVAQEDKSLEVKKEAVQTLLNLKQDEARALEEKTSPPPGFVPDDATVPTVPNDNVKPSE